MFLKKTFKFLLPGLAAAAVLAAPLQAACINAFMTGLDEYQAGQRSSKANFRVNELLVLCFKVERAGYISVFDSPAEGDFEQLYPNRLTHQNGETHARIEAGEQLCFGQPGTFPMYHPPEEGLGLGKVSVVLTEDAEMQLDPGGYAIPGQRVAKATMDTHLRSHSRSGASCTQRDVTYLDYRVTN